MPARSMFVSTFVKPSVFLDFVIGNFSVSPRFAIS
jgi:hypothetical protein